MTNPEVIKTKVGIVGGGPAGLMLSHLLSKAGIDNVVVEKRDHETIRTTHRAGILEHGSVAMLVDSGVSDRVLKAGYKHEGIDLRFGGESHRIDTHNVFRGRLPDAANADCKRRLQRHSDRPRRALHLLGYWWHRPCRLPGCR